MVVVVLTLISLLVIIAPIANTEDDLCSKKGLPPPDLPFRVVWNHPDNCPWRGYPLNLGKYSIVYNPNRRFLGAKVKTLYRPGRWPTIRGREYINGGLPMLFKDNGFEDTWASFRRQYTKNFTGEAVIDFEKWRAIYITNFGRLKIYKRETEKLLRKKYPKYSNAMLQKEATKVWEKAAKRIFLGKLTAGQTLMPGGHWGYYGYPQTWAGSSTASQNNKISWLWRQATGLFPSIYMFNPKTPRSNKVKNVVKTITEAVRIQTTHSPPNTAIYAYNTIQTYNQYFFPKDHLRITQELPADMGASGTIEWGSSSYYHSHVQCPRLQHYICTVLGPFVHNLTQVMANCSKTLCWGNGRCIHNSRDSLLGETDSKRLSSQCTSRSSPFRDYHCRCYYSWEGACCQRSPCYPELTAKIRNLSSVKSAITATTGASTIAAVAAIATVAVAAVIIVVVGAVKLYLGAKPNQPKPTGSTLQNNAQACMTNQESPACTSQSEPPKCTSE